MHLFLTGRPPFGGDTNAEIKNNIKTAFLDTSALESAYISDKAINFLKHLLNKDFTERISALQALQDPWIKQYRSSLSSDPVILQSAMENLITFSCSSKLKDAIQTFITNQIITHNETEELLKIFKNIDKNGDGKLSKNEMIKFYSATMGDSVGRDVATDIFKMVDADGDGFLQYTEFLRASVRHTTMLCKKNLEIAFSMFDKDGSGKISAVELQEMLGGSTLGQQKTWIDIIKEADQNKDGEIDIKEFYSLLINKF